MTCYLIFSSILLKGKPRLREERATDNAMYVLRNKGSNQGQQASSRRHIFPTTYGNFTVSMFMWYHWWERRSVQCFLMVTESLTGNPALPHSLD